MTSMTGFLGPTGTSVGQKMTGAGNIIPKGYKEGKMAQFTPEQMQLFSQLFGHVGPQSYLSRLAGGEEGLFQEMEAPAMRQFQEYLGNIASRFSGTGERQMSGRRGSAFNLATSQAASDFAQDLASRRQLLQMQAIRDLMGAGESLLGQRPYQQFFIKPEERNILAKILGIGLPAAGAIAGGLSGAGPMGAALGGQLGSSLASGFTGSGATPSYAGIGDLPTKWS